MDCAGRSFTSVASCYDTSSQSTERIHVAVFAPWTRWACAILLEVSDHGVCDLQLHAVALAAGPLGAQRERLVAIALRQSGAIRGTSHELVRDEDVLLPAEPVFPNEHVAQRFFLG